MESDWCTNDCSFSSFNETYSANYNDEKQSENRCFNQKLGRVKCRNRFVNTNTCYNTILLKRKETKLINAASTNNTELLEELIKAGVNVNSCDHYYNRSALHISVSRGYVDVVKILLENGADSNITDNNLNTPLHIATCTQNYVIVILLIEHGACILLKDRNNLNPLQIAISKLKLCEKIIPRISESVTECKTYINNIKKINEVVLVHYEKQKQQKEYEDLKLVTKQFGKNLKTKKIGTNFEKHIEMLLEKLEKISVNEKS